MYYASNKYFTNPIQFYIKSINLRYFVFEGDSGSPLWKWDLNKEGLKRPSSYTFVFEKP